MDLKPEIQMAVDRVLEVAVREAGNFRGPDYLRFLEVLDWEIAIMIDEFKAGRQSEDPE